MQARFAFRAATVTGGFVEGTEEAASEAALRHLLAQRGLFPVDISLAANAPADRRARAGALVARGGDVAASVSTLASLLEAGLPLDRALAVAQRGAARRDVDEALGQALRTVREGGRLSDAMAAHPRLFPEVAVGLVRAADQGGDLGVAMRRLAEHLERAVRLRARISAAVTYPILLVVAGTVALTVLVFYVLPRFVALLADAGSALPTSTRLLLAASGLLTRFWPAVVLLLAAVALGWVRLRSTPEGRERSDALLLRLPLVGSLRAEQACSRLARSLGTLLAGGLPLVGALEIAREAAGDWAIRAHVRTVAEALRRGVSFSVALGRSPHVPHVMLRLVEVGEETGQLDVLLERSAAMMEEDLERRLDRLITLVEPLLIALFGLVIGFVALALLQAIYGVNTTAF